MKFKAILRSMYSRQDRAGNCQWCFQWIDLASGQMVDGLLSAGGESNVYGIVHEMGFAAEAVYYYCADISISEFKEVTKGWESAGCRPADLAAFIKQRLTPVEEPPIPMILFCPACGEQHIDAAAPDVCEVCGQAAARCQCSTFTAWLNPPHKSHRCGFCNIVFRPADVPTTGVASIKTKGSGDSQYDSAVEQLRAWREARRAILKAISEDGDDLCWRDLFTELARLVDENFVPKMLSKEAMLRNCDLFIDSLQSGPYEPASVYEDAARKVAAWYVSFAEQNGIRSTSDATMAEIIDHSASEGQAIDELSAVLADVMVGKVRV